MALGLGDIHLHSSLNAPLDADIDLIGATPEDLSSLKAAVASRETFQKNGLDWPAFMSTVTLKPMHTSDGRDIIKVHSGVAITEPFATLLVEINWARGHVAHEYTVLLDPPVYTPDQSQAAAPVAAPAVGASPRGGAIQREPAAAPAPAAQAAAPPAAPAASAALATAGQTYQVQRGDTLSRIAAHEAATTSAPERRRWMVATYQGNLDSFDKNMNLLRAGAVLRLPDAASLGAVSAGEAAAEVRRQNVAWHGAAASTSAPSAAPASDAGRLHLVTPGTPATTPGSAAGAGADTRALQGKVQQLQSQLDDAQRLLSIRNADLAKLQLQLAAAQSAAKAATTQRRPRHPRRRLRHPLPPPARLRSRHSPPAPPEQASAPTEAAVPRLPPATMVAAASAPVVKHRPHMFRWPLKKAGSILGLVRQYWWALLALVAVIAAFFGLRALRARRQQL